MQCFRKQIINTKSVYFFVIYIPTYYDISNRPFNQFSIQSTVDKFINRRSSEITDSYSFHDNVAQVQSRPLAAVSGKLVSQLNDLATSPPQDVEV